MRSSKGPLRTAVSIAVPLAMLALVLALARRDRGSTRPRAALAGRETLVVAVPDVVAAAGAVARRDPLAEIHEAEERARRAREELEGVGRELDERKRELERLRGEADADARRSRDELERARRDLERQRDDLEEAARDADRRLRATRDEMQALERQQRAQLEATAGAGVARGLGAGGVVPPGLDPRLARRGGMPPLVPEAAIVAAAGSRGAMPAAGQGQDPGLPPVSVPTTAAGAALQGQAQLVDAQGRASLNASQAAINTQTAEALALQNRLAATEVFFERRRANRAARALEAGPPATLDQIIGYAAAARVPPLDDVQLDRLTGEIAWPRLFRDPVFADEVAAVDRGFRERATWGGSRGYAADEGLIAAIDALVARLKDNVSRYPGGKYGAARLFVDGLRAAVEEPDRGP